MGYKRWSVIVRSIIEMYTWVPVGMRVLYSVLPSYASLLYYINQSNVFLHTKSSHPISFLFDMCLLLNVRTVCMFNVKESITGSASLGLPGLAGKGVITCNGYLPREDMGTQI